LFLSEHKIHFFICHLKLLGHVIDDAGIAMDPDKVNSIATWKVPTNKDLLAGFLGTVGYLASGCHGIRIPMGCLMKLTGKTHPWRWTATEQCAFDDIRVIVQKWRTTHWTNLDYAPDVPPINLTCDASHTGGGSVISQGSNLATARIVTFWSSKFIQCMNKSC